MSDILVTGARGMIGSHFMERVPGAKGLDNLYQDDLKTDITSYEELERAFKEEKPDIVVHIAGEVGRLNGEKYPNRMLKTNGLGTLNVARLCLEYGCKLINFSTSEVYGSAFDGNVVDEDTPLDALGATNVYAISKMFGEAIVKHYSDNYGLKAVTIRPFMVYGEGERVSKYRSALNNFIAQALSGKSLLVHKDTLRSWCYVDDFLDGLQLVMQKTLWMDYEAYNIGNERYMTAEETAKLVIEITGSNSKIELVNAPTIFSSPIKRDSIEKVKALGYRPKVSLEEGIRKLVGWQRRKIEA